MGSARPPEDLAALLSELSDSSEELDELLTDLAAHQDADLDDLFGVSCPGCGLRFLP